MPYCPNCRSEYRPGFDTCADCGAGLVEELLPQEEPAPQREIDYSPGKGWVKLVNVLDDYEAELVLEMLKSEGIPVLKKAQGAGGGLAVVKGTEIGIDLYVPYAAMRAARTILRQDELGSTGTAQQGETAGQLSAREEQVKDGFKLTRVLGLFLVLIFVLIIVLSLR